MLFFLMVAISSSVGLLVSAIISKFIDGLIGFHFARQHQKDQDEWLKIGLDAISHFRYRTKNSEWNFSNKVSLPEKMLQ